MNLTLHYLKTVYIQDDKFKGNQNSFLKFLFYSLIYFDFVILSVVIDITLLGPYRFSKSPT